MNDLHYISASINADALQTVDPRFIREKLLHAQMQSWNVLKRIKDEINQGTTEDEARKLALKICSGFGVSKHWHKPYIRFGTGTTLTFHDPLQSEYRLQTGDPFYIDLGPVWHDAESGLDYEGDVGDTFIFGENSEAEKCAETARTLFQEAKSKWQTGCLTGCEIYVFLNRRASELGYALLEKVDGHRLGDFPHQKYSKERLAKLPFCPKSSLWVLEVQITHPELKIGSFYEDLL